MARRSRSDEPFGWYHVTQRGIDGLALFGSDDDRTLFLSFLARTCERESWRCLAYCLMTTHYHVLIRNGERRLGRGMNWLCGMYARVYNNMRGRRGHVFGERYRVALIASEDHLAANYVELNPVRAGMRTRAEDWAWSSRRAHAGLDLMPPFLMSYDELFNEQVPAPEGLALVRRGAST